MLDTLQLHLYAPDLAGQNYQYPNYKQIQERIQFLVKHYLAKEELCDRLQDLPIQFDNPQPRPWQAIDATFSFTCIYILNRLWGWSKSLTPEYLQALFGEPLQVTSYLTLLNLIAN